MTNAEYHAAEGISSSDFRLLEESPQHLANKRLFQLSGKSFDLGNLVHKMVLEPDDLKNEFVPESFEGCDLNKNSKAYKEAKAAWLETVGDKTVVTADMWQQAKDMTERVNAIVGNLLRDGEAEKSVFVKDELYEITRKCRPDYYRSDFRIIIDLKTTKDGSEYAFSKGIHDYRYHRQAAWYLSTMNMAGYKAEMFLFVVVETTAPYMVSVYELDADSIRRGEENYQELLLKWMEYRKQGAASVVKKISLPQWAN